MHMFTNNKLKGECRNFGPMETEVSLPTLKIRMVIGSGLQGKMIKYVTRYVPLCRIARVQNQADTYKYPCRYLSFLVER